MTLRPAATAMIALAFAACSGEPSQNVEPSNGTFAIRNVTALVGTDLVPVEDAVVVVEDGIITAAGPASEVVVPDGTRAVDGDAGVLIPGWIDCHVHIGFVDPHDVLAGGVTTVRDLAWPPDDIWPIVIASKAPDHDGPEVVATGQMLTAQGGYPTQAGWAPEGTGRVIDSIDDASAAVAEQANRGAVAIKIALNPPVGPVLSADVLKAVVDAAHDEGLRVTSHIHGLAELEKALDAGVDELGHMLMSEEEIPGPTIERMVTDGVTIVPTLSIRAGRDLDLAIRNLRAFVEAGGKVAYGTDLGNAGPRPGIDPSEVAAMAAAGLSPSAIVRSATVDAAAALGLEDRGSLAPGLRADLVLLPGNALEDQSLLSRVIAVWRGGRRV